VAFANGLNTKSLLDSLSVGCADTVDQIVQEKGRVGRDLETAARGVVFYQPSSLIAAEQQLTGKFSYIRRVMMFVLTHVRGPSTTSTMAQPKSAKKATPKRTKKPKPLEHAKAQLLAEKHCYNACLNRIF
jgi:hypothetical protein